MCFNLDDRRNRNVVLPLFLFMLTAVVYIHQVYYAILEDVKKIKTKTEDITHLDKTSKSMKNSMERVKEELREFETEISKLKLEMLLNKMDKTGLIDFAYGGRVVSIRNTETYESRGLELLGVLRFCRLSYLENRILESSVMPGDCWPIKGQEGNAVIELIEEIFVTKVTMEHVSRNLLPNSTVNTAPKEFTVWGLQDVAVKDSGHFFGQFTYDISGPEVQTFPIQNPSSKMFRIVEFKIHSNHGNPDFTCIYRVRVHGHK